MEIERLVSEKYKGQASDAAPSCIISFRLIYLISSLLFFNKLATDHFVHGKADTCGITIFVKADFA